MGIVTGGELNLDNAPIYLQETEHSFALNLVNSSDDADIKGNSNEEANEIIGDKIFEHTKQNGSKIKMIPIGKVYIGNGQVCIFSVSDSNDNISEIGIFTDNGDYTVEVNDELSIAEDKLNFNIAKPIDAVYRLRKGCERTVYFTDDYNNPRYYNFDKPQNFKNTNGTWVNRNFSLFSRYATIPFMGNFQVQEGGNLMSGSYNFAIQYIDVELNTTEWITTCEPIIIFDDNLKNRFAHIFGSSGKKEFYRDEIRTTKSIKFNIIHLSTSTVGSTYPFYRVAVMCSNDGSGRVNKVLTSQLISSQISEFTFDNESTLESQTTIEEIQQEHLVIERAKNIEQIENRLILSNTEGKQTKYCNLQKYASKIKADCVLEEIDLIDITKENNPKRPTIYNEKIGYQPGEIYSFGIVYVFKDNTLSPVYHIPGKNHSTDKLIFSPGANVYPMEIEHNQSVAVYTETNACQSSDLWGVDSEGTPLKNNPIRHHRFPLRSKLKKPLINQTTTNKTGIKTCLKFKPILELDFWDGGVKRYFKVSYLLNGVLKTRIVSGTTKRGDQNGSGSNSSTMWIDETIDCIVGGTISYVGYVWCKEDGTPKTQAEIDAETNNWDVDGSSKLDNQDVFSYTQSPFSEKVFTAKTEIFGIKFSGIELPNKADINDEVVGYYIVRNKRNEEDKTILDTGVLFPLIEKPDKFIASGMMFPRINAGSQSIDKRTQSIVHPEYKYYSKEYSNYEIIQEGIFERKDFRLTTNLIQDVQAGTSFNSEVQEGDDPDGMDLRTLSRQNWVEYKMLNTPIITTPNDVEDYFTLTVLRNKEVEYATGVKKDIFNVCGDNNEAHFTLKEDRTIDLQKEEIEKPFVVMRKLLSNNYQNFKTRPYYKQSNLTAIANSEITIFQGDSFISSMNYHRSMYYETRIATRDEKGKNLLEVIGGTLIALGGLALTILSAGTLAVVGVGMMVLGVGMALSGTISNIELSEAIDIYTKKWEEGLKDCVRDKFTEDYFINCKDDEIRWFSDTATNLWFESQVNCNWRLKADLVTYFMDSPGNLVSRHLINNNQINGTFGSTMGYGGGFAGGGPTLPLNPSTPIGTELAVGERINEATTATKDYLNTYLLSKLTAVDSDNKGGRLYKINSNPEIYDENLDFKRRNEGKLYYHLADEYDCCSKCTEDFPHRVHYSEQSYQEELSDNYKKFLHNNYKDIEGELGEIMDIFRLGNQLYVHTKEALWQLPKNYQERVTGEITTFIGTGSFFEIPPQRMIDDDTGTSVGIQHKWSSVKTIDSYYFINERERKVYVFNGQNIRPISDNKVRQWFWENLQIEKDKVHYDTNKKEYPYRDNTSNPIGTGFISVYDAEKKRVIFTKKDYQLNIPQTNYEVCYKNGVTTIFPNINQTIYNQQQAGWTYLGVDADTCRLKFVKNVLTNVVETRTERRNKFKDVDFLVFRYNFGSANGNDLDTRTELLTPVARGPIGYGRTTNYDGIYLQWGRDNTGTGLESILIDVKKIKQDFPGQNEITFKCGAWWYGTRGDGNMNMNAEGYQGGIMNHVNFDFTNSGGALMGTYSFPQVNINVPPSGSAGTNDANFQPYNNMGVFTYKIDTGELSCAGLSGGSVPPEEEIVTTTITVQKLVQQYSYIDGQILNTTGTINSGWSISYQVPDEEQKGKWLSFHSYRPDYYIHTQNHFFGYINNQINLWKFNVKGLYQKFFGINYPFILELNIKSKDIETKIWDFISFLTEAKQYNSTTKSYLNVRDITFDEILFYNTRQSTGILQITHKNYGSVWNVPDPNYLKKQIDNNGVSILAEKDEKEWTINEIRDYVISQTEPLFIKDKTTVLTGGAWRDKTVNPNAISLTKNWTQQEVFRDKFITVRFIFNNFAQYHTPNTIKLIFNYLRDNGITSYR